MSDKPTRVPLNSHPSHLHPLGTRYGALEDNASENYYFSAVNSSNSTPACSPPISLRSQIESFAGSYSRTSALYMAENLSVQLDKEEDLESTLRYPPLLEEDHVKSRLIPIDYTLSKTISSHGGNAYLSFPLSRHVTAASVISHQLAPHKDSLQRSTFVQSVFNSVNVLVGIGILAYPIAFRCSGWVLGTCIFLFCTLATNYTAKVIAKCLDFYPNSTTYGDMGAAAFGERGRVFVSTIFVIELMTIG